jgi:hypothetical protein
VNFILKPIYEDYALLRRDLIDLGLLSRDQYGHTYIKTDKKIVLKEN